MDNRERAILRTLLYADIFDFPLTSHEIYDYLISGKLIKRDLIDQSLKELNLPIGFSKNLYFLKGREDLVKKRLEKQKISEAKIKKAEGIISFFRFVPTALFVGISGSLSMKNAGRDDDIDIFVITKKNFLWTTRFMLIVLLNIMGVYRISESLDLKDRICLNMMIDEDSMYFEKDKQSLYLAHEVAQLVPILDRE